MPNLMLPTGLQNVTADGSGNLNVNFSGTISGGNAAAGLTGAAVPTSADYVGFNVGGNLVGVSAANPLPITGSISATNPSVAPTGAAIPADATMVGGSDGTDLRALLTDSTGQLKVLIENASAIPISAASLPLPTGAATAANQAAPGTAGSPSAAVTSVQGVSGGTAVPISGTITFPATPTVFIEGHAGAQLDGTAGSPSAGVLTVQGVSGGTAIPTSPQADSAPATQNVTTLDLVSTSTSQANGQLAITGAPTAGSAASFALASMESVQIQVTGTWTGTLATEVSVDGGTTWFASGIKQVGASYIASSFTANFTGDNNVAGCTNVRVRATAAMTGTAVVLVNRSLNPALLRIANPLTLRDSTTQSIANTIKAASTAAVATDTALVVALSPNNTPSVLGAFGAEGTAAWTSGTAVNSAVTVNCQGMSTVTVVLNQGSTLTGGVVTFEVSDSTAFTNAYGIIVNEPNNQVNNGVLTYTFVASTNQPFNVNVAGFSSFRVRLSTVISGTGTVNVGVQAIAAPTTPYSNVGIVNIANIRSTASVAFLADNQANNNYLASSNGTNDPLAIADWQYGGLFSGTANATLQGWSKARTPTIFKTASVSATASGNTAVWTPGSGNKFRLLGFVITAQGLSATAAGVLTVSLQDGTSGITFGTFDVDIPATAGLITGVSNISASWIPMGAFGILSAAANNVLNFNVSATLTGATGTFRINACGTEE